MSEEAKEPEVIEPPVEPPVKEPKEPKKKPRNVKKKEELPLPAMDARFFAGLLSTQRQMEYESRAARFSQFAIT